MSDARQAAFREAYANLNLRPLLQAEEIKALRVDNEIEVIDNLEQLIDDSPEKDSKIVFTGHRGCGKSTLLFRLKERLEQQYLVLFFSIAELIEPAEINHLNILYAIGLKLLECLDSTDLNAGTKGEFRRFLLPSEKKDAVEAELDFGLIKLRYQQDREFRKNIEQRFRLEITGLLNVINRMVGVLEFRCPKKRMVVIIDDLDKLDLALVRLIFTENIKLVFSPKVHIIFTLPVAAVRDVSLLSTLKTETDNQVQVMHVPKLYAKNAKVPEASTLTLLRQMVARRISLDLIDPNIFDEILLSSGGAFRELIRLVNECCRICLRKLRRSEVDVRIDGVVLAEAKKNLRNDIQATLGNQDLIILEEVREKKRPDDAQSEKFLALLHALYVLEYRNSSVWYDVHPLVGEILDQEP